MAFEVEDFMTLMTLEDHGPDVYVGVGPVYPWGRVYGGQVVAQALRAACSTIPEGYSVHSLHAYFIRGGECEEPIRYEVDRIRNGRSFVTRRVVARQSVGPILNLSASFQIREDEADVQEARMPEKLVPPENLTGDFLEEILERRAIPTEGAHASAWVRVTGPLPEDPMIQACALAFASDEIPTDAASRSHPSHKTLTDDPGSWGKTFIGASLDHTIWFHRSGRNEDWVLHDFQGHGVVGGRGLTIGQLYSQSGVHMATIAQEILIRIRTR